jgi:hypothetical protein
MQLFIRSRSFGHADIANASFSSKLIIHLYLSEQVNDACLSQLSDLLKFPDKERVICNEIICHINVRKITTVQTDLQATISSCSTYR